LTTEDPVASTADTEVKFKAPVLKKTAVRTSEGTDTVEVDVFVRVTWIRFGPERILKSTSAARVPLVPVYPRSARLALVHVNPINAAANVDRNNLFQHLIIFNSLIVEDW